MIYKANTDLPKQLKKLWATRKTPARTLAEASEIMGMTPQYFGILCNGRRAMNVENLLKIAAFFDMPPKEIDKAFPDWAIFPREYRAVITPMFYEPSAGILNKLKNECQNYQSTTNTTQEAIAYCLELAPVTLSHYLNGKNKLNAEFILKVSALTEKHPLYFDENFPAFLLVK